MADVDSTHGPYGAVFQIIPGVQSYDWGKTTKQGSLVAAFAASTKEARFDAQEGKPYAELWMGTHPTLPSYVVPPSTLGSSSASSASSSSSFTPLNKYLAQYPALIGNKVRAKFPSASADHDGELPFLFKILSIGKALSIQAHPDKQLAKRLHVEKPNMYKDDNHKPEMAIALTDFRGFCGFRPLAQIEGFLKSVPEFAAVVKQSSETPSSSNGSSAESKSTDRKKTQLRAIFANLMNADKSLVEENVDALAKRYRTSLEQGKKVEVDDELAKLVCTLNEQFPRDVGVLCAFVLNVVTLTPGQAIFLQANEPHAYLDGEIVECMAASDNVVRAGLTPKARDVQVLVDMLTYEDTPSNEKRMQPTPFKPDDKSASAERYDTKQATDVPSFEYNPPIDEFSVVRTSLDEDQQETHRAIDGPSLLIVTQGEGTLSDKESVKLELQQAGQVFFIGAGAKITLTSTGKEALITYRAFVESE